MYCPNCGKYNKPSAKFCKYCNFRLKRTQNNHKNLHKRFILALERFFTNYFNLTGTSSKSDYWSMYAWFFIGAFLLNCICILLSHTNKEISFKETYAQIAYSIIMFIPIFTLSWRRYKNTVHDTLMFLLFIALDIVYFLLYAFMLGCVSI